MSFVGGSPAEEKGKEDNGGTGRGENGIGKIPGEVGSGPSIIKAGTIYFAVLDTAVDSDYPDTPVMATIVQGPFQGSKVLGKLALAQGQDKLSLNFTLMDKDNWEEAKSISAFAIDPDTARTVMANEVDHHYLLRYGAIMGTAFLTGYSSAITEAGTSTTGIFGTSSTHPELSPTSKIAVGLGQVGTTLGAAAQTYVNTPATVKIHAGVSIGILFTAPVTEDQKKVPTMVRK
jgi:intracellular multiplication protein IcmE